MCHVYEYSCENCGHELISNDPDDMKVSERPRCPTCCEPMRRKPEVKAKEVLIYGSRRGNYSKKG